MSDNVFTALKFSSAEERQREVEDFLRNHGDEPLYVFAYASLMWSPCFSYTESFKAVVKGYRRNFCIASIIHRGTKENPGIVMGLVEGGECEGILFRLDPATLVADLETLWKREMPSGAYIPTMVKAVCPREIPALAFVASPNHPQFICSMEEAKIIECLRTCQGQSGSNKKYFEETLAAMRRLDIHDNDLESLAMQLQKLCP